MKRFVILAALAAAVAAASPARAHMSLDCLEAILVHSIEVSSEYAKPLMQLVPV